VSERSEVQQPGYSSKDVKKGKKERKLTATGAKGPNVEKRKLFIKNTIAMVPPD
jgi:hypothetical protein